MSVRQSFGFPLSIAVKTDVGRVRTNNEDSHGHAWLDDGSLFVIVADGMGGHEAGEVASGLAVRVAEESVARDVEVDPRERLYNGLLESNEAILEESKISGTQGMGTTAISAILQGSKIYIGQVGDSRLFHVRKGQVVWRTLDHTRVQMLLDQGEISEEEAREHPESGMLTRALGHARMADGRPLVPDVLEEPIEIETDDTVILSSDGLHDLVEDWEIARMVAGKRPAEAAELLVETACERGGHDNITVAVIVAGQRGQEFDADFQPEWDDEPWDDDLPKAEETFEEFPTDGHPPVSVTIPPTPPPEPARGGGMVKWVAAVGVVGLGVGGLLILLLLLGGYFFLV